MLLGGDLPTPRPSKPQSPRTSIPNNLKASKPCPAEVATLSQTALEKTCSGACAGCSDCYTRGRGGDHDLSVSLPNYKYRRPAFPRGALERRRPPSRIGQSLREAINYSVVDSLLVLVRALLSE
jgi:hypothetical protein